MGKATITITCGKDEIKMEVEAMGQKQTQTQPLPEGQECDASKMDCDQLQNSMHMGPHLVANLLSTGATVLGGKTRLINVWIVATGGVLSGMATSALILVGMKRRVTAQPP